MKKIIIFLFLIIILCFSVEVSIFAGENELLGAGATFPYPLYSKMFDVYYRQYGIKINYQAIGSGGGIRQLISKTVDFGGTDAYMTDEELKNADSQILHLPTCLGGVGITYNLPGNPELKFTPEVLADIFFGKIKKWNDNRIKNINPDVNLPAIRIIVIHRSDGSGTTFIFSDYLSKISKDWENKMGRGKSLNWPAGLGAKGNAGVAGFIKQTPGAIGYIELIYALQNNMPVAKIMNRSGNFIKPDPHSVSFAADIKLPSDTRVSITDTKMANGYPISGFTWLIFYKEQNYGGRSIQHAKVLKNLLLWIIHEGQAYTEPLLYAPLPEGMIKEVEQIIFSVQYSGKSLK